MGRKAIITAVGHYVPPNVLTNKDLEKMVDTSDEWITTRTGIKERHILDKDKGTSYMGARAAEMALQERGISPEEVDMIMVATVTPDMMFPNTACLIQEAIGAKNAWGVDLNGACTGFVYALATAAQFVETGRYQKVLVIGADKMSSIVDYQDRNNCVLFGDAGAAVLLEPGEDEEYGVLDFILKSDGSGGKYLYMPAGGSLHPASHETVEKRMHYIRQEGRTVFKFAVTGMAEVTEAILKKNNLTGKDIKYFVPHQANLRIIDATGKRLGLEPEQVLVNIDRYGNTTAATIPLGISELYHDGKLQKGDLILMAAFGAGFTWGSLLLRWAI
ncbi:MAG TPA: ketoacyl-ACP synthase III [Calditrichae bacterium]|nr:ketoacyl-ACP synthase III [Calditrichia bacterium]